MRYEKLKRLLAVLAVLALLLTSAPGMTAITEALPSYTLQTSEEQPAATAQIGGELALAQAGAAVSPDTLSLISDEAAAQGYADLFEDRTDAVYLTQLQLLGADGAPAELLSGELLLTLTVPEDELAILTAVEVFRCETDENGAEWLRHIPEFELDPNAHTVSFHTQQLGVFAVCYCLDYPQQTPEYRLAEGGKTLLSEVFSELHIMRDPAEAERIVPTDEELFALTRYEAGDDWVIQSLRPFESGEALSVVFADESQLRIPVTDAGEYTESNDLADFLTDWSITVGDTVFSEDTVGENTVIEFKDGMQYSLELSFAERTELGFLTPETDPPAMIYQLPDGFAVPSDFQMPLNINLGRKGVLADNIVSVFTDEDGAGNTHSYLRLTWNWQDALHWGFFRDSAQAKLKIIVNGVFRDEEPHVLSINGKDVAIRREDLHNAIVNKEGFFNRDTGIIDYTVTVTSDGTTSDITLTDTLGSALTYLTDPAHGGGIVYDPARSVNTANTVPQITQKTGNTFQVVIPAMSDKDSLVFTYSAFVDYDAIAVSGNPSFAETGNTAQIFGDSYTVDNIAMYHETNIDFSDLEKNCVGKQSFAIAGNPAYRLSWEIDTNKRAQYPLADSTITDTINEDIQSFSKYYGEGVTIRCFTESGALAETRQLTWEDLGVDLETDVTWTYHIPDTDPNYHYTLTYDTVVYMDGRTQTVVAGNTAEGKGGIDSDRAVLTPPGTGGFHISKQATNVDSTHVTWEMVLTVSGSALDSQRIVLREHSGSKNSGTTWSADTMPSRWLQLEGDSNRIYKETLKKVEVVGLQDDETFEIVYGQLNTPSNQRTYYPEPGSGVLETNFVGYQWGGDACSLEFFKDSARTVGGLTKPEGESPTRSLTVRFTVEFPENWATVARDYMLQTASRDSSVFSHINWIAVESPDSSGKLTTRAFDTDKISPLPAHVYKTLLNNTDSTLATADQKKYYMLNFPDMLVRPWNTTENGTSYRGLPVFPCFRYQVLVSGIKYDEPLVIEDSFDTSLLTVMTAADFEGGGGRYVMTNEGRQWTHTYFMKVFGMNEYGWTPDSGVENYTGTPYLYGFGFANTNYYLKAEDHGCTLEKTDTGFRVTINELMKRPDGSLFPFYGIDYYLIPKNLEALKTIEEMARINALAGGEPKALFTNTASARGTSASATVKIGITNDFMPLDKTSETYLDLLNPYQGQTRIKLEDTDMGGVTVRDTPEGISSSDIQRYVMKYSVVLNKGRERLNDGADITAEDEYSANLSVDFTSIHITTEPENVAVSYDFSGNVGYFTFPDETKVTIEYEAVVLQTTAAVVDVSNEVRMLQYKKTLDDHVDHGGAGGSSATNPAILIKKYGSGHMEKGLNGAQFQLFEYNYPTYSRGDPNTAADWTPVILTKPEPHEAIFTTHDLYVGEKHYGDGYAEIELRQDEDGTTLQTQKVYGLREITTPTSLATNGDTINYQNPHSDDFFCYIFSICGDDQTADYSSFIYLPDDTMTIRNTPESIALHLSKHLDGNCALTDADKLLLEYQLFRKRQIGDEIQYMPIMIGATDPETGLDVELLDDRFVGITYNEIADQGNGVDITGLTVESGATVGEYLLVEYGNLEVLQNHPDWDSWRGTYAWSDGTTGRFSNATHTVYDVEGLNPQQVYGVEFTVSSQEIRDGEDKTLVLTDAFNREMLNLSVNKRWTGPSGSAIPWPSGKKVTFTLGTLDENDVFVPLLGVPAIVVDNQKDGSGEDQAGTATFKNVPKRLLQGGSVQTVRYAVRETSTVSGYDVVYPVAGSSYAAFDSGTSVTVKNQVISTSVSVSKLWERLPSGNPTATFRLFSYTGSDSAAASWVSNVNDIVLDGTPDGGEDTFGEKTAWRADFTGLPMYDNSGTLLHYLVKEIAASPAGYEPVEPYAFNGGAITNRPASAVFTVSKQWSGTPNDAWPSGESITVRLLRKTRGGALDAGFSADYVLSADAIVSQDSILDPYGEPRQSGTFANGTLTVSQLPKYDDEGNEWLYYATEVAVTNIASGEDLSGTYATAYRDRNNYPVSNAYAYSGGAITNTKSSRELAISKTVSGNMGDRTASFDFTVLLQGTDLYQGEAACTRIAANGDETTETLTFTDGVAELSLRHGETAILHDLSGSLRYTVTESAANAGDYDTTFTTNGENPTAGKTATGTLADNPQLAFENRRQVIVLTGVGGVFPGWLAALTVLLLIGMLAGFKKRVKR